MLTYYRRRTDKAHKIILHFFQRLDSNMDSEMMGAIKNRKRITVRYNFCLVEMFVTSKRTIEKCTLIP